VVEAMRAFIEERFGNPSNAHAYGRAARDALITSAVEHPATLQPCAFLARSVIPASIAGVTRNVRRARTNLDQGVDGTSVGRMPLDITMLLA
jgi:cysteine sulfinate desulfinase/cysteine desulfurase-like protein